MSKIPIKVVNSPYSQSSTSRFYATSNNMKHINDNFILFYLYFLFPNFWFHIFLSWYFCMSERCCGRMYRTGRFGRQVQLLTSRIASYHWQIKDSCQSSDYSSFKFRLHSECKKIKNIHHFPSEKLKEKKKF